MPSEPNDEGLRQKPIESDLGSSTESTTAESKLMFLHPSSLAFDLIAHGRTYLVPFALALFGAAKGELFWVVISAIFFVPAVLVSIFRYLTLRYRIEDDHLIVDQGLIFRKTRTVPVTRIQNIDLVQNVLHRIFGVAEVKVETASGTEPEATLRVLSLSQVDLLRDAIFRIKRVPQESSETSSPQDLPAVAPEIPVGAGIDISNSSAMPEEHGSPSSLYENETEQPELILSLSVMQLVQAGLASNRGLVMVGVAFGAYYQFFDGASSIVQLFDWLPKFDSLETTVLAIAVALIAGGILLRLLSIGWYVLRFFGYRLERRGNDLRISCGLFTRVSATIPRKRIQFISIHRPLLMRWMGLASIRIETAGGSGEKQGATESVSKRWFVPVTTEARVAGIVGVLRPGLVWDESKLTYQPMAPRAFSRMARLSILMSIILIVAGLAFSRPWGFVPGLIAIAPMLAWSKKAIAIHAV